MTKRQKKNLKVHIIFILSISLCLFLYQKTESVIFQYIAVGIGIFYLMVFLMGTLFRGGSLKPLTMEEARKEIKKHKDTSDWTKTKGVISKFIPGNRVSDNGGVVAQIFAFYIQTERETGVIRTDKAYVGGHIIPVSHIGSFGINTPVQVLVNKTGAWAVFDPENESWHHEVKK